MRGLITESGELVLTPESNTEAYALRQWMNEFTADHQPVIQVLITRQLEEPEHELEGILELST